MTNPGNGKWIRTIDLKINRPALYSLSYTVHLFYRHMAQNFRLSRYSRLFSFLYASCSKDMLRYAFQVWITEPATPAHRWCRRRYRPVLAFDVCGLPRDSNHTYPFWSNLLLRTRCRTDWCTWSPWKESTCWVLPSLPINQRSLPLNFKTAEIHP